MTRAVALLGSINVGGNRLKMGDLRAALGAAGFAGVETVIASGNVLFDPAGEAASASEARMAQVLESAFGIAGFVTVRSRGELAAALAESPFAEEGDPKQVHVHFLEAQPDAAAFAQLEADHAGRGPERMAPGTRALHIDYAGGVADSKLTAAFIARRLGCAGTARNINSLRRILAKMEQA